MLEAILPKRQEYLNPSPQAKAADLFRRIEEQGLARDRIWTNES
jgi:hypothetical protein